MDAYISLLTSSNVYSGRHFGGANVAFLDGHVKWFLADKIERDGYAIGGTGPAPAGSACP